MATITITTADGIRIGADLEAYPWTHPAMVHGVVCSIDVGSALNGGGLMLRCHAHGIHIGGEAARALLGPGHPAVAASRRETEMAIRARSRATRRLDRRRLLGR